MKKVIGICGLGVFGSSVAKSASSLGAEVIAIDQDIKNIERLEQYLVQGVQGDFTDLNLLKQVGFDHCDIVLVASSTNLESAILAVLNLQQLGVKEIMVKAKNKQDLLIYTKLGATRVIRPEKEMGERVAKEIMRSQIIEAIDIDDDYSVIEFIIPNNWVGKTLMQLQLRQRYDMNVLGVKKHEKDSMNVNVNIDYRFEANDILIVLTQTKRFETIDLEHD